MGEVELFVNHWSPLGGNDDLLPRGILDGFACSQILCFSSLKLRGHAMTSGIALIEKEGQGHRHQTCAEVDA